MHISALYESVTNRIIEEMKVGPNHMEIGKDDRVMPMNAATGRAYNGINVRY